MRLQPRLHARDHKRDGGMVLARFHWAVYAFGGALAIFGLKLMFSRGEAKDGFAVRLSRRLLPMAEGTHGTFTVRQGGRLLATPMLGALFAAEAADLAFAVESIPAVYAITSDPFIVFSSNALALLGMRSLYFLLAQWLERFTSLKPALALILVFVGMKMLLGKALPISPLASVTVIAALLAGALSVDVLRRFWKRAAA